MVQVKDLTELKIEDLWREVKGEEEWWGDLKQETLRMLKRLLESAMEELLSFLDCPQEHWKKIRTTNVIERAFREVRRRTRPGRRNPFVNLYTYPDTTYKNFRQENSGGIRERPPIIRSA